MDDPGIQLRGYQLEAARQVLAAWAAGSRKALLCMPTGSGKRLMGLWFCRLAQLHGKRTLFVGNRRLLITQAADEAQKVGLDYGVIMADLFQGDPGAGNQIASIQTLESWYFYEKWTSVPTGRGLPPADIVIVDEAHQDLERYRLLLGFYPEAKVLGLTATPVGPEGVSLVPGLYDVLLEGAKNTELIRNGFLLPTTVFAPSEPFLAGVKVVKRQEYNQSQLGRAVKECTVFGDVFDEWEPFRERATVVFVPGVAFGSDLAAKFNARLGLGQAHLIHAKTKIQDRHAIFDSLQAGESKIVLSVDVLREGWDLPAVSCAIDLQPVQQLRSFWQKVGRIKRPAPGQDHAVLLDFAGNYWHFPHPDEDPDWPQGQETTQDRIEKKQREQAGDKNLSCPKCFLVYSPTSRPPTCPGCGFVINGQPVRRVRMGSGKLVEMPLAQKEEDDSRRRVQRNLRKWQSSLFAGLKTGRTFGQCAVLYHKTTGEWPKPHWPGAAARGSDHWKQRVAAVYNSGRLCRDIQAELRSLE